MINDNAFSKILVPIPISDQSQTTGVVSFQDPNNSPIGPDVDNNHLLLSRHVDLHSDCLTGAYASS